MEGLWGRRGSPVGPDLGMHVEPRNQQGMAPGVYFGELGLRGGSFAQEGKTSSFAGLNLRLRDGL